MFWLGYYVELQLIPLTQVTKWDTFELQGDNIICWYIHTVRSNTA